MFYRLPPVGNPVSLNAKPNLVAASFFSTNQIRFYNSGTAALAAAICAAKELKKNTNPEVILPAYACPDLVSAAVFAGVKPVLVDFEAGRPWLDLSQLAHAITENTIAIIGVNLFGIAERWKQLSELAIHNNVVLIEDSAQYFPGGDEQHDWKGDLVVLSFGRGKPVSLLGGGAVLAKSTELFDLLPKPEVKTASIRQRLSFELKARIYNVMISPYLYWLPLMLPFLHLGETRYHALEGIEAMDQVRSELLTSNLSEYQNDIEATGRCKKISSMLDSLDNVNNLPRICKMKANRRLLRYPLLLDAASRNSIYTKLKQAGLGPSILYPACLPRITGLSHIIDDKKCFPNAEMFASQILTLPTHSYVSDGIIEEMKTILSETVQ